jgi:hypothetical protein
VTYEMRSLSDAEVDMVAGGVGPVVAFVAGAAAGAAVAAVSFAAGAAVAGAAWAIAGAMSDDDKGVAIAPGT